MKIENELWGFAKAFYTDLEVSSVLLTLQNKYGYNVNQLIFAVWLAAKGQKLTLLCEPNSGDRLWNAQVTTPLRAIRKRVKALMEESAQDKAQFLKCYKQILAAELNAEQVELAKMYAAYEHYSESALADDAKLVNENLALCRINGDKSAVTDNTAFELCWSTLEKGAIEHINGIR
ncbi:MAG: TIGR02444 family protein [Oceanospirillaceae bacterium]|nr:TIGR02444 family protein [Oceanospirillaceae bacterium]